MKCNSYGENGSRNILVELKAFTLLNSKTWCNEENHEYKKDSLISKINDIMDIEMIVVYSADAPLDRESFKKNIDESRQQVREGKVLTQEELEKRSEKW